MKTAEAMAIRTSKTNRTILAINAIPLKKLRQLGDIGRNPPPLLSSLG
jgi:hypothetical protein